MSSIGSSGKSVPQGPVAAKKQARTALERTPERRADTHVDDSASVFDTDQKQDRRPSEQRKEVPVSNSSHAVGLSFGRAPSANPLSLPLTGSRSDVLRLRGGAPKRSASSTPYDRPAKTQIPGNPAIPGNALSSGSSTNSPTQSLASANTISRVSTSAGHQTTSAVPMRTTKKSTTHSKSKSLARTQPLGGPTSSALDATSLAVSPAINKVTGVMLTGGERTVTNARWNRRNLEIHQIKHPDLLQLSTRQDVKRVAESLASTNNPAYRYKNDYVSPNPGENRTKESVLRADITTGRIVSVMPDDVVKTSFTKMPGKETLDYMKRNEEDDKSRG